MKVLLRTLTCLLLGTTPASYAKNASLFIIVNDTWRGHTTLNFSDPKHPCLTAPLLQEWGIRYKNLGRISFSAAGCAQASSLTSAHIHSEYDEKAQMLILTIPPGLLSNIVNGVATSRWDDGINAAFVDYDISYSHFTGKSYDTTPRQHSLEIDTTYGLNLAAWRFRYKPVFTKDPYSDPRWRTDNAQAFRTLRSLRSLLTLGDNATSSDMFDSVSYRGVSLSTDDRMLPDELRPLSPWIHGFARTEAQVKIRQYGTVIYQTTVHPGAFVLKDIYPVNASGDIEMTIKEEDGSETVRNIPWSAMPNLVHKNQWKFAFTTGKYRPYYLLEEEQPWFSQLTLSYGLPQDVTLFGGTSVSNFYQSGLAGVGRRFEGLGALSVDLSVSSAQDPRRPRSDRGTMARLRYNKALSEWESSFSLTAQYYPDQRYRTFSEAVSQQNRNWWDWDNGVFVGEFDAEKKNKFAVSYTQNITEEDSFYLTLESETLRGRKKRETTLEIGYNGSWNKIDYSLYAEYNRPEEEKEESKITFSVAIPFQLFATRRIKLNVENALAKNGDASRKVGISGTALEDYSLSYNLSNTLEEGNGSSQKMTVDYQHNAGELMAIYTNKKLTSAKYIGATGSIIAHEGGVTLGQSMGETVAIVEVEKTGNIGITNQYGTTTDRRGFALIGNLTPYRVNELMLDTFSLGVDRQLPVSEMDVVPTAGAIMHSRFMPPVRTAP
ncbi:fimbria/pilus outer membrane usher protein [Erwinia amylovora]